MEKLGVGIIGAGNISSTYLRLGPLFRSLDMRAVADISMDAASARAEEFGVRAQSVDDLLAADDIDLVVNLTIPNVHYEVSKRVLQAGKHVYSEKPLVLTLAEGEDLRAVADASNLRVGSAPDTFLGGAHQLARAYLDEGMIGDVVAGTAAVMSHGMEHWHPNPDFFFQPGAGPVLDVGPFYITNLIQFLGPVARVAAVATSASDTRTITADCARNGEEIAVETPTNIQSILHFEGGATITFIASWDVWAHGHAHMELYGTEGSLFLPDPNFFGGSCTAPKVRSFCPIPISLADHCRPLAVTVKFATSMAGIIPLAVRTRARARITAPPDWPIWPRQSLMGAITAVRWKLRFTPWMS
jgi:predicted dehydrogenase